MNDAPQSTASTRPTPHLLRYVLIGFFTVAPLWVTWIVFDFVFSLLAKAGGPFLRAGARAVQPFSDTLARWLDNPTVHYVLAALVTIAGLYAVGLLASVVVGKRMIAWFERLLERLPGVQTIYGATKRFLQTIREPSVRGQRVVLIAFPSPDMKAVGFITKVFRDQTSDRELAAVYVPTSPNPTSGYIEIVPLSDVVVTDWTMEEAMTFVMTGGTNAPDEVRFTQPSPPP